MQRCPDHDGPRCQLHCPTTCSAHGRTACPECEPVDAPLDPLALSLADSAFLDLPPGTPDMDRLTDAIAAYVYATSHEHHVNGVRASCSLAEWREHRTTR